MIVLVEQLGEVRLNCRQLSLGSLGRLAAGDADPCHRFPGPLPDMRRKITECLLGHPAVGMPKQDDRGPFALKVGQVRNVTTQARKLDGWQTVSHVDAAKIAMTG